MQPNSRAKTIFLCQECGHTSPRWEGKCASCGIWDTYVIFSEPKIKSSGNGIRHSEPNRASPINLGSVVDNAPHRMSSGMGELDRLLGGGVVQGSMTLMAGEPGVGKSTLLLQMAAHMTMNGLNVLYVSGEESQIQVGLRAQRLGVSASTVKFLSEINVEQVLLQSDLLRSDSPLVLIIDSIQTLNTEHIPAAPGTVAQVRECSQLLLRWAKESGSPVFLAGHVTKDGTIAGPRVLEHMVDVVVQMEGEPLSNYRMIHCIKNRFGATGDVALFEMSRDGLAEVPDPSAAFISERQQDVPGSTVVVTLEGSRPLLAEVQALTNTTAFSPPRRMSNGMDFGRMLMVTAVLSRRVGLGLANQDIMVNIPGGLRITEPAGDLALALTIASSFQDIPLDPHMVVMGEIGLNGEIRRVPQLDRRLAEATRHGFTHAMVPSKQTSERIDTTGLELIQVGDIREALLNAKSLLRRTPSSTI